MNEPSATRAKTAVLEHLQAIYGEHVRIIRQGQMYATSAPGSDVGTTSPVETWVFEAETGEGKTMTLVASQLLRRWSMRKMTSDSNDPLASFSQRCCRCALLAGRASSDQEPLVTCRRVTFRTFTLKGLGRSSRAAFRRLSHSRETPQFSCLCISASTDVSRRSCQHCCQK